MNEINHVVNMIRKALSDCDHTFLMMHLFTDNSVCISTRPCIVLSKTIIKKTNLAD